MLKSKVFVALVYVILSIKFVGAEALCPLPQKGKNIAGFILACDYSKTILEQDPEALKRGKRYAVQTVNGTEADQAHYRYLGQQFGIEMQNLCAEKSTKADLLKKIRDIASESTQYVFMGLSGHGGYVPIFKGDKLVAFKWAFMLDGKTLPRKCIEYWNELRSTIQESGLDKAQTIMGDKKHFAASKRFSLLCGDAFLTYEEITKELDGKQLLTIADSCYSGGICAKDSNTKQIVAMAAGPLKESQTLNLFSPEDEGKFNETCRSEIECLQAANEAEVLSFLNEYVKKHPEIKSSEEKRTQLYAKLRKELAEHKGLSHESRSPTLEAMLKEVFILENDKKRMRELILPFFATDKMAAEIVKREAAQPQYHIGELNFNLFSRDMTALDKNKDGFVSVEEYFSNFTPAVDTGNGGTVSIARGCEESWLKYPLFDLKKMPPNPPELEAYQHGKDVRELIPE